MTPGIGRWSAGVCGVRRARRHRHAVQLALPERDRRSIGTTRCSFVGRRAASPSADARSGAVRPLPSVVGVGRVRRGERDERARSRRLRWSAALRRSRSASRSRRSRAPTRSATRSASAPPAACGSRTRPAQVGGSHKARHLFTILLHLRTAEVARPGAVATARASGRRWRSPRAATRRSPRRRWPRPSTGRSTVFVPPTADPAVLDLLAALGATIVPCPRSADDPPGDPCVHRFREAVADGAVPFSVQGTENVWCLDGGRTIGWEMGAAGVAARPAVRPGRWRGAGRVRRAGLAPTGSTPRLHAVQTDGVARRWCGPGTARRLRHARDAGGAAGRR